VQVQVLSPANLPHQGLAANDRKSFFVAPGKIGRKSGAPEAIRHICVAIATLVFETGTALKFATSFRKCKMAWLYQDPDSRNYKVCFRHNGRSYKKSLRTKENSVAEGILGGVKRTLMRLEQNLLSLPPGTDVLTFVLSDGRRAEKPPPDIKVVTLQDVIDRHTAACSVGAMEQNSLDTVKMHLRHITKTLGKSFAMDTLKMTDLQRHVERRAKQRGIHKQPLSHCLRACGDDQEEIESLFCGRQCMADFWDLLTESLEDDAPI
jgi:hypothetical protein